MLSRDRNPVTIYKGNEDDRIRLIVVKVDIRASIVFINKRWGV